MIIPGMGTMFGGHTPPPPSVNISFLEGRVTLGSDPGSASHSWGGVNFGSAIAGRLLVACFSSVSFGSLAAVSATIGGVAATVALQNADAPGGNASATAIFYAVVPSGSSGAVQVNWSANGGDGATMALYRITGYGSATPSDTDTSAGSLIIPANGVAVGSLSSRSAAGGSIRGTHQHNTGGGFGTDYSQIFNNGTVANQANANAYASWGP